jgi:uncharacterized membrane protein
MTNDIRPQETEDEATIKATYVIYILYMLICVPALPLLGIIFAYIFENDAKSILKSHYTYLIRSFWIGLLYFSISASLVLLLIGFALLPICIIWWLIRLVKGLKSLMRNEPISNPKTWIF